MLSTSFVLPVIAHPYEYSGIMFELLMQKKKKKEDYEILASGGRYDKLVNIFKIALTIFIHTTFTNVCDVLCDCA